MKKNMETRALIAAFSGNAIFGFSFLFTRIALNYTSPYLLLCYRFLTAFLILNVIRLLGRISFSFRGKPWQLLLLLGVFQPVLYFWGESYGVLYTSATFSAVMIALIPIVSLGFSALFLKERATLTQTLFCILSILGVLLMNHNGAGGTQQGKGILLLLLAVLSDVAFHLTSRRLADAFSPFERTYVMFGIGAVFFTVMAILENHAQPTAFLTALQTPILLSSILYLALISSVLAFFLLNYANTYLPITRTIVFVNVTTILSVLAGVVFLHEQLTLGSCMASVMIVIGVWGVQRPQKQLESN